ncbi:amidohydrolase [Streptomyces sp. NBC_01727]|uniref:amidohydrolase n=1 Tax=unclassified Streptomyces TaxID=2593676 RepID=UPI002E16893A|nr:amidohydrolase [Streptomyces sp. NBC_01727]
MPVDGIPADPEAREPADFVLRNARVYTGDTARPAAAALAVRNGRITAVGDDADITPHVGPATRVVDALNRRVIPGLNDSHLHVIRGGVNYLLELRWDGVPSLRTALWMLREQAARTPKGQWVRVVGGWTGEQFAERRLPTVSELNAAAPETPVFVLHLYQSAILNRAAVKAVGFTKDSVAPPGGQIVRNHAGEPTGVLLAAPAAGLLYSTLGKGPSLSDEDQVGSTRHFLHELNRLGLTSAIDAGGGFQNFPENYAAVMKLAEQGLLPLRIAYHLFPQTAGQELDDLRRWIETARPGDGDEWLRLNGAGENLAWSPADYENFAEPRPLRPERADRELEAAVRLLLDNGWGFRLHATYDETIRANLDVFDKVAADGGFPRGVPWFFDHAETVSEASLDRIASMGGALSIQNRMMFQGNAFAERYGSAIAAHTPPIRRMLDHGLTVAAGSDATRVSSYNPWLSLEWLVRGRTIGGRLLAAPENRMDRAAALHMYTAAGAELSGESDVKGILKQGYYGDMVVLSEDFFTVPEEDISHIESLLTVVGGRVVYAAGEFEGIAAPLPAVEPSWSPVTYFGGYHRTMFPTPPSGVRQARAVVEAAAESEEHRQWRMAQGFAPNGATADEIFDSCFVL